MQLDVSFIVPVYNKGRNLRRCLESIIEQTLKATEVICINDGSTDSSAEVLRKLARLDPRLRVLNNERNLGAGQSRNRGITEAKAQYIRFVDADDLLPIKSTETLYRRAVEVDADLVRGSLAIFRGVNLPGLRSVYSVPDRAETTLQAEPSLWIPWWHTSYLMSTKFVRANHLLYPELKRGEDPVFLASALTRAGRISLVPEIVYYYRKPWLSSSSAPPTIRDIEDFLVHIAEVKSIFYRYHIGCWERGYGPFVLESFQQYCARCRMTATQNDYIASKVRQIWGVGSSVKPLDDF